MTDFKPHVIIGFVSVGLLIVVLNYVFNRKINDNVGVMMLGVATIYSMLPDIDQKSSIIYRFFIIGSAITAIYLYKTHQQKIALGLLVLIIFVNLVNHRTIFHSLLFGAITSAPFFWISPYIALAAFTAFTSHLVADGAVSWYGEKDWW